MEMNTQPYKREKIVPYKDISEIKMKPDMYRYSHLKRFSSSKLIGMTLKGDIDTGLYIVPFI